MIPWWLIASYIFVVLVIQVCLGLLVVGLVHDMVVRAYRQLWREQQAAILLNEENLEDTPPAKELM